MPPVVTVSGKARRADSSSSRFSGTLAERPQHLRVAELAQVGIAGLLIASAIFVHATKWEKVREINLFALILAVQSLPFLSAVAIATLESSRANEFAAWRALGTRVAALLPQRGPIVEAPATVEKRIEPVQ